MCVAAKQLHTCRKKAHLLFLTAGWMRLTGFNAPHMQNCCKTKEIIIMVECHLTVTQFGFFSHGFGDVRTRNPYWQRACNGLSRANTAQSHLGWLEVHVMFALNASDPPPICCFDTENCGAQHSAEMVCDATAAAANTACNHPISKCQLLQEIVCFIKKKNTEHDFSPF